MQCNAMQCSTKEPSLMCALQECACLLLLLVPLFEWSRCVKLWYTFTVRLARPAQQITHSLTYSQQQQQQNKQPQSKFNLQ